MGWSNRLLRVTAALAAAGAPACSKGGTGGADAGETSEATGDTGETTETSSESTGGPVLDVGDIPLPGTCAPPAPEPDTPPPPPPVPAPDPEDQTPPQLASLSFGGPRELVLEFTEAVADVDGIDPSDFRLSFQDSLQPYYSELLDEIGEEIAVDALRNDSSDRQLVVLSLSGGEAWDRCDEGFDTGIDCGPYEHGIRLHYRAASPVVEDASGNPLGDIAAWWVDADLPDPPGGVHETPPYQTLYPNPCFVSSDRARVESITIHDEQTLRVTFTQPMANACDVDPAQFRLSLVHHYESDCSDGCEPDVTYSWYEPVTDGGAYVGIEELRNAEDDDHAVFVRLTGSLQDTCAFLADPPPLEPCTYGVHGDVWDGIMLHMRIDPDATDAALRSTDGRLAQSFGAPYVEHDDDSLKVERFHNGGDGNSFQCE